MPQPLPKVGYVIRTKDGRPVMIDPSIQLSPNGVRTEFTISDKGMAEKILLYLLPDAVAQGVELEIVEKPIDPSEVYWIMDENDIHEKALEERRRSPNDVG